MATYSVPTVRGVFGLVIIEDMGANGDLVCSPSYMGMKSEHLPPDQHLSFVSWFQARYRSITAVNGVIRIPRTAEEAIRSPPGTLIQFSSIVQQLEDDIRNGFNGKDLPVVGRANAVIGAGLAQQRLSQMLELTMDDLRQRGIWATKTIPVGSMLRCIGPRVQFSTFVLPKGPDMPFTNVYFPDGSDLPIMAHLSEEERKTVRETRNLYLAAQLR